MVMDVVLYFHGFSEKYTKAPGDMGKRATISLQCPCSIKWPGEASARNYFWFHEGAQGDYDNFRYDDLSVSKALLKLGRMHQYFLTSCWACFPTELAGDKTLKNWEIRTRGIDSTWSQGIQIKFLLIGWFFFGGGDFKTSRKPNVTFLNPSHPRKAVSAAVKASRILLDKFFTRCHIAQQTVSSRLLVSGCSMGG